MLVTRSPVSLSFTIWWETGSPTHRFVSSVGGGSEPVSLQPVHLKSVWHPAVRLCDRTCVIPQQHPHGCCYLSRCDVFNQLWLRGCAGCPLETVNCSPFKTEKGRLLIWTSPLTVVLMRLVMPEWLTWLVLLPWPWVFAFHLFSYSSCALKMESGYIYSVFIRARHGGLVERCSYWHTCCFSNGSTETQWRGFMQLLSASACTRLLFCYLLT